jgi:hypothetical protein
VNDPASVLYSGQITRTLDRQRTLERQQTNQNQMTAQIDQRHAPSNADGNSNVSFSSDHSMGGRKAGFSDDEVERQKLAKKYTNEFEDSQIPPGLVLIRSKAEEDECMKKYEGVLAVKMSDSKVS